jgi:hypothetical protein
MLRDTEHLSTKGIVCRSAAGAPLMEISIKRAFAPLLWLALLLFAVGTSTAATLDQ